MDRYERAILRSEIEEFLAYEALLLDTLRLEEWLDLFTDDVVYQVPLSFNVRHDERADATSRLGQDICWIDDTKDVLLMRVEQIRTGVHWAEEPLSRSAHLISNVVLEDIALPTVNVSSRVLMYRNRVASDTDILVGRRSDQLSQDQDGTWRIRKRVVYLDQSVLMQKNLTIPI